MSNPALFALTVAAGLSAPAAVLGQRAVEPSMAGPQPHFVAAWAPNEASEAKQSPVLTGRVSLYLANVSLDTALKELTSRARLHMTYSPSLLPPARRVTISAKDIPVATAIREILFRSGLDVAVDRDGALALVTCRHLTTKATAPRGWMIVGRVTESRAGAELVGATVAVEGLRDAVLTDDAGRFQIGPTSAGTYSVRVRHIGYIPEAQYVTVGPGQDAVAEFSLEKSVQQMEQVVVAGTMLPTEVRAVPTPVTVVRGLTIEAQRPRTMAQLFRQMVPSAVAPDFGTAPQQTALSVRGGTVLSPGEGSIKVFIDGIEVTSRTLAAIDLASVDHIEVIRGPQAATIYGSDAIGGVMQVFTKKGGSSTSAPTVEAEAALGPIQSPYSGSGAVQQEYRASLHGGTTTASYHVGGGYRRLGAWTSEGAASTPSAYGATHFELGALAIDLSSRMYVNRNSGAVDPTLAGTGLVFFSKPSYQTFQYRQQTHGAQLTYKAADWWKHNLRIGYDRVETDGDQSQRRLTSPADTFVFALNQDESKTYAAYNTSALVHLGASSIASVTVGFDHYSAGSSQYVTSGTLNDEGGMLATPGPPAGGARDGVTNTGYFAQGQLELAGRLSLTAGARLEENSTFGAELGSPVSSRIGVAYHRTVGGTTFKIRGAYGEAIQAPAAGQSQASTFPGGAQLANPRLGPARQHGFDLGVDVYLGRLGSLSATYYDQTTRDLIQLVNPDTIQQFQNVGRIENRGVELEAMVATGRLEARAQYAYTRSKVEELGSAYVGDLRAGDQLPLIPRHTAGAALTGALGGGTTASAGLTLVGERDFTDFLALYGCLGGTSACRATSRGYVRSYPAFVKLNFSTTQSITPFISAFVAIENITNNVASEFGGLVPVPGRITTLGVRFRHK